MNRPAIQVRVSGTLTIVRAKRIGRIHRSRLRSVVAIDDSGPILSIRLSGYTWWAFPRRRARRMAGK